MDQLSPNLGAKIVPKRSPRPIPRGTLHGRLKTLILLTVLQFCYIFGVPGDLWDTTFRLKLGVWTQHVIQVSLQVSCEPPWCWKCRKWGPNLGPNMGVTNWLFRPLNLLGSILGPSCPPNGPKTLQEAILGPSWYDFGAILVHFLCHVGAILVTFFVIFWAQAGWKNVPTWLQNSLVKSIKPMSKPTARWRLVGAAGG